MTEVEREFMKSATNIILTEGSRLSVKSPGILPLLIRFYQIGWSWNVYVVQQRRRVDKNANGHRSAGGLGMDRIFNPPE